MFKQMIVISSLLAGIGAAGMAMYLQTNPLALSHGNRVDLETYIYSAKAEPAPQHNIANTQPAAPASEAQTGDVMTLPEVVVTRARPAERSAASFKSIDALGPSHAEGSLSTPALPEKTHESAPATPRELTPCSDFRELGPMHVDDGVPSGVRGVRDLC